MLGTVGIVACASLFFDFLHSREVFWINVAAVMAIGVVYACLYGPEGSLFASQFPPEVRYTGISLAVQVSGAIGGGLAPIMATWLLARGDGNPAYVAWYLGALGVVACISAFKMHGGERFAPIPKPLAKAAP